MRSDRILYSSVTFAVEGKCRLGREIHVWKFCDRAIVQGLDSMKRIDRVELDNKVLRHLDDYVIRGNRIVFLKRLLPFENHSHWLWQWLNGWLPTSPRCYYLAVVGEHNDRKKNTIHE